MVSAIGKPFITICAFLGILVAMTSMMSGIFTGGHAFDSAQSQLARNALNNTFSASDFQDYVALEPFTYPASSMGFGTSWNVYANIPFTDSTEIIFEQTPDNVRVFPMNSYQDHQPYAIDGTNFVVFQNWGWLEGAVCVVTGEEIISSYSEIKGYSQIDVLLKVGYIFIVNNDTGVAMEDAMFTHSQFNITVAQTVLNASLASSSVFGIVTNILTFSLPDAGYGVVNMILAAVLIPTYVFIIFIVIRSLIPLLGG
jgi:hypothetical protein